MALDSGVSDGAECLVDGPYQGTKGGAVGRNAAYGRLSPALHLAGQLGVTHIVDDHTPDAINIRQGASAGCGGLRCDMRAKVGVYTIPYTGPTRATQVNQVNLHHIMAHINTDVSAFYIGMRKSGGVNTI